MTSRIVLITGANKGIGRETARRLVEAGHDVYLGARGETRGRVAARETGAGFVQLDVTNAASVAEAIRTVGNRSGRLDVLVNNAGISDNTVDVENISAQRAREVFDTNVVGVIEVTQAALPLLRRSERGAIINVSSGLGSFAANTDPSRPESTTPLVTYAASKAALQMLTLKYAQALPELRINAVCPGLTATDFAAGFPGAQPVEDAVDVILAAIQSDETGTLREAKGPLAW